MRLATILAVGTVFVLAAFQYNPVGLSPTYVGSQVCIGCHQSMHPDIVNEYAKTGHPYKLNAVNGAAPTYPANTAPRAVEPPAGTTWNDFAYVIGGYGWKARFVKKDGRVWTAGPDGQHNLADGSRVAYHEGQEVKYNYACFKCHTTGASPEGSWNGVAADSLGTFSEAGVRCEGCHGPGSDHAAGADSPPNTGDVLRITVCGTCHQRGGTSNAIPASGGYIQHHEQINEMRASQHGNGDGTDLTCASCHDAHVATHYPDAAGAGFQGITEPCQTCHSDKKVLVNDVEKPIECTSCHMPKAGKSALGTTTGNGFVGDVNTHIWAINTSPVGRNAMFSADGKSVALDQDGIAAVTMDFACLGCHTDKTVEWAADYAPVVHSANGVHTAAETLAEVPGEFNLEQNYPNPFNPTTAIGFDLNETALVVLSVYDMAGRKVAEILNQTMPAGRHSVRLSAEDFSSGVYVYELRAGNSRQARTMVVGK